MISSPTTRQAEGTHAMVFDIGLPSPFLRDVFSIASELRRHYAISRPHTAQESTRFGFRVNSLPEVNIHPYGSCLEVENPDRRLMIWKDLTTIPQFHSMSDDGWAIQSTFATSTRQILLRITYYCSERVYPAIAWSTRGRARGSVILG